jgi:hypothetical protein
MMDMSEFEKQLRAEVAAAEASAEQAFASLREHSGHPNSGEFQMMKSFALMTGGVYTGLTKALSLITGEPEFERANAAVASWTNPTT